MILHTDGESFVQDVAQILSSFTDANGAHWIVLKDDSLLQVDECPQEVMDLMTAELS